MTETSPPAARFAPNGDRYTSALCIDANSLYLWSTEQLQPLTPGLRWVKSNQKYQKQYLSTGGSFAALQYLYYSQALLDAQGLNVNIEHQYFQGEKFVYGYKCDGYVNINGKEIVYEFHGKYKSYQQNKISNKIRYRTKSDIAQNRISNKIRYRRKQISIKRYR